MSRRRLLITTDCIGGVWRYSIGLAQGLQRRRWRVALGIVGPSPSEHQRSEAKNADVEVIECDAPLDWEAGAEGVERARKALRLRAEEWGAGLVQINQPAYCGDDWRIPVVAALHSCVESWWRTVKHTSAPEAWRWHKEAVASGLRNADYVIAPSRSFAKVAAAIYGNARPIRVVYNGSARAVALATAARSPFALAAGRLWDEGKNIGALDAAAASIDWPVRIAGSHAGPGGNCSGYRFAEHLGELDADEMRRAQESAAIFVSPSVYEPFGLAVLEAALSGAALALSDIPVFRELWGDTAAYFNPRSPASIAATVNDLIRDKSARLDFAARARRRAQQFNLHTQADQMEATYLALLSPAALSQEAVG